jgi:general L-amino acid transport system substrate-binding protein
VGDVVDVRGPDMRHQRHPARIGHDVVFGPRLAAIGWVRSSFFPPIARTDLLSTTVQRWSRGPRRRSSARRVLCKRRQTPARSHSTKRRQHVLPEPHPVSRGNICHGNPPRSTNRMPVSAARSETRGRPPRRRARRRSFGSKGSNAPTAHRPRRPVPYATVPSRPRK